MFRDAPQAFGGTSRKSKRAPLSDEARPHLPRAGPRPANARRPGETPLPGAGTPGLAGVGTPVLARPRERLLDLDRGPDLLELLLDRGRLLLGDALLHDLGGTVHEVLGLLQAQAGDLAHDLDHVDLLVARAHEVDRELRLLLGRRRGESTA